MLHNHLLRVGQHGLEFAQDERCANLLVEVPDLHCYLFGLKPLDSLNEDLCGDHEDLLSSRRPSSTYQHVSSSEDQAHSSDRHVSAWL